MKNLPKILSILGENINIDLSDFQICDPTTFKSMSLQEKENIPFIILKGTGYKVEKKPGDFCIDTNPNPPGTRPYSVTYEFIGSAGGHNHGSSGYNNGLPIKEVFNVPQDSYQYTIGPACGEVIATLGVDGVAGGWRIPCRISFDKDAFISLESSDDYVLIGSTAKHISNHWGYPSTIQKLKEIAKEYRTITGDKLYYNDMSLKWGGIFDINGNYSSPHAEHRNGNTIDIAATNVTLKHEKKFIDILKKHTTNYILEGTGSSRHYHVRF